MSSQQELNFLLDFPNNSKLEFSKGINSDSSIKQVANSAIYFSSKANSQLSNLKIRTKVDKILNDSELYLNIFKNLKTKQQTLEKSNMKDIFNSNNKNVEKVKLNMLNYFKEEPIDESKENPNPFKRKFSEAFGNKEMTQGEENGIDEKRFKFNNTVTQSTIDNFFKLK